MTKLYTTSVRQIGILVRDFDESVAAFEKFLNHPCDYRGVTEPYEVTGQQLRGKPCTGRCQQALFNLENIQIELISPCGEGDSVWRESLEKDGEGLHHIAFKTNNIQGAMASVSARSNAELMQYGTWPDDPAPGQYAYLDARGKLSTIVELMESPEGEPWDRLQEYTPA